MATGTKVESDDNREGYEKIVGKGVRMSSFEAVGSAMWGVHIFT